jgi:hypothetical protein
MLCSFLFLSHQSTGEQDERVSLALYPGEGHHYAEHWRSASVCDLWGRIPDRLEKSL